MAQARIKFEFTYTNDYGRTNSQMIEFEGVLRNIERRFKETSSDYVREQMEKYMAEQPCPSCKGYRLKPETLAVKIAGNHIAEVTDYSIQEAQRLFQ